jgi:SAM-dependent methyltransferase
MEPEHSREKSRAQFQRVFDQWLHAHHVDRSGDVLILGASAEDGYSFEQAGFSQITLSQLGTKEESGPDTSSESTCLDAEAIALEDGSHDVVFVHEVLHHCRSPHGALCEMLRVSRRHVAVMEPHDSAAMRLLTRLQLSSPFELPAVIGNDGVRGGVRDTCIPNYLYRWNERDVRKSVSAFLPEFELSVFCYPYWDFNITEELLDLRTEARLSVLSRIFGKTNFLRLLRFMQAVLNRVPPLRAQGNKFFFAIRRDDILRPWLDRRDDEIVFRRPEDRSD